MIFIDQKLFLKIGQLAHSSLSIHWIGSIREIDDLTTSKGTQPCLGLLEKGFFFLVKEGGARYGGFCHATINFD